MHCVPQHLLATIKLSQGYHLDAHWSNYYIWWSDNVFSYQYKKSSASQVILLSIFVESKNNSTSSHSVTFEYKIDTIATLYTLKIMSMAVLNMTQFKYSGEWWGCSNFVWMSPHWPFTHSMRMWICSCFVTFLSTPNQTASCLDGLFGYCTTPESNSDFMIANAIRQW